MALGRPVNKDTQYKVIVHTLGKHRYASTKVFMVGEDGKKRYSYKHWGALDESNRFHPGVNYFYASTGERDKLIFPADWDMGDLSELSSTRRRGRVSYQAGGRGFIKASGCGDAKEIVRNSILHRAAGHRGPSTCIQLS